MIRVEDQAASLRRMAQVLHSPQSFAANLQQAGYATDPQYASKLSRVIQTAMNLQRTAT